MRAALDPAFAKKWDGLKTAGENGATSVGAEVAGIERDIAAAAGPPRARTAALLASEIGFLRRWAERREVDRLRRLRFDEPFYAERNRDVDFARTPAALHYVRSGRREGRPARFRLQWDGVEMEPILR